MPPHDASHRNSDGLARLRKYVGTDSVDQGRDRPGIVGCKRPVVAPAGSAYDDEDDGPITIRWTSG